MKYSYAKLTCLSVYVVLLWIVSVPTTKSEESEESSAAGNYTLVSSDATSTPGTSNGTVCIVLYGDSKTGSSCYRVTCKDGPRSIVDIDYVGRICAIKMWISEGNCALANINLTDTTSGDTAIFHITFRLNSTQRIYNRSDSLDQEWSDWGEWSECLGENRTRRRSCKGSAPQKCRHCPGLERQTEDCSSQATDTAAKDGEWSGSATDILIPVVVVVLAILLVIVIAIICYCRKLNKLKALSKAQVHYDKVEGNSQSPIDFLSPTDQSINSSLSPTTQSEPSLTPSWTPIIIVTCPSADISDKESMTDGLADENTLLALTNPDSDERLITTRYPSGMEWEENDLYVSANC